MWRELSHYTPPLCGAGRAGQRPRPEAGLNAMAIMVQYSMPVQNPPITLGHRMALRSMVNRLRPADYTETQIVVRARRVAPVANRRSAFPGDVVPAAATSHRVGARRGPGGIGRRG